MRRRSRLAIGAAALIVAGVLGYAGYRLLFLGAGPTGPASPEPAARLNLLLITLDTTRADRLGCYGYARARTRHMDRLASEGVRFEWAFSPAPITLPAHASILTGLYPFSHGVRNNGNFYLDEKFETITSRLKAAGYSTAAFMSAFVLDRRYGLARGFDTYDDRMEGARRQIISLESQRRGDRTALALGEWLDQQSADPEAPFFAWLHLYDPHEPYNAPPPFGRAFADSPYDGEVAFDDAIVASVVDRLGRLQLLDTTLIAIVGDHGESLGEHGEESHSMFVYEAAVRVPFIIWQPGRVPGGVVVTEPVRLTDVATTLLELMGEGPLVTEHGRSLVPLIEGRGRGSAPPVYAETLMPKLYMNWAPLTMLRDDRWKLIRAPRPELYDLQTDPREERNLYDERPQTARAMGDQLAAVTGGSEGAMSTGRIDRDAMERLAALGYVGAGAEPASGGDGAGRDPKDVIKVFNRLREANSAVRDRRFKDALPILRAVLAEDPRNAFAQLVLGSAYMGMNQFRPAIEQYRQYLALVPTSSYAHLWIAVCHLRLGERDMAAKEAEAALAIDPKYSDARILRGGVFAARGDYDAAVRELRAAVDSDPAKPLIRLDLARVLAEAGRLEEAEREFQAALKLQPEYVPALIGLGGLYARRGETARAEEVLRRAIAIEPAQAEAHLNLARLLEGVGRADEARAEYEAVLKSPTSTPTLRSEARQRLKSLGSTPR